jgi:DNA-binding PadR family transcriptional regulator
MSPFQIAILEIIKANDGKFSWYQLDRALTQRVGGWDPGIVSKDLMPALRELEQAGFIATSAGHNPAQPLYSITPAGQQEGETVPGKRWRGEKVSAGEKASGTL